MKKPKKSKEQSVVDKKPETRDATFTREGVVEIVTREADGDKPAAKLVRLSVSSEEPYLKWVWDDEAKDWVRAYEVLGHKPGEIDYSRMKGGLVIQDGHYGKQIGIIDTPEVKDGKLGGFVRFGHSQDAKDCEADALDGIRKNMSVGYFVGEYKRDGVAEDGHPIFRAVKWTPFEGSFVNVPADTTVGVGRSREDENSEGGNAEPLQKGTTMTKEEIEAAIAAAVKENTEASMKRVAELEAELKALKEKKPETPAPVAAAKAFDEKDQALIAKKYDILAVVRALAGEKVDVGFARELSDQIAKAAHKEARGLFIPDAAFRTLTGKTNVDSHITGNGAALVATDLLAGSYIDALVARTVLGAAGVQTLSGLVGDIAIPKGGSASAGWLTAEDGDATVAEPAFSQVPGTPHTVSSNVDISRKLALQSALPVQTLISGMILDALARGIEAAAFDGTGSSGQPTGVSATVGVNSIATLVAGAPTHDALVDFWEKVYTANAGGASMKFIGSPAVKALLCKTRDILAFNNTGAKASSAVVGAVGGEFLCTKDGQVEGYDFLMSGLCNAKKLYFGDWSQLILAFWSGIDLTVDPYSLSTKGALRLVAFQDCDVLVRHPQAFAVGTAIS